MEKRPKSKAEQLLERLKGAQSTSMNARAQKVSLPKAPWEEDTSKKEDDDGTEG